MNTLLTALGVGGGQKVEGSALEEVKQRSRHCLFSCQRRQRLNPLLSFALQKLLS